MRNVRNRFIAIWKRYKIVRIICYFLALPVLFILAILSYGATVTGITFSELWVKILAWMFLPISIISYFLVIRVLYKLFKELGLKLVPILCALYLLFTFYSFPWMYTYGLSGIRTVTSYQKQTLYRLVDILILKAPRDLYLAATGQEYLKYTHKTDTSLSLKEAGFDVIAECTNITFSKPFVIGLKGMVKIYSEYDQSASSIILYQSPSQISNYTEKYPVGDELIIKEGPVPSDSDQTFFWKVGYEGDNSKDGWCSDYFGPSPQG
jgi:hypothetical protein